MQNPHMSKEEKKQYWITKNNTFYGIPEVEGMHFWGTEDNRMITPASKDIDPTYVKPLIQSLKSLVGQSDFGHWFRHLTLLLAFPEELSQEEKQGHEDCLRDAFCLNYFLPKSFKKGTQYNLSQESIQAIHSLRNKSIGLPDESGFFKKFDRALKELPEYAQIQQEFADILSQLAEEAQKEPLKGYLQAFKQQRSIPKLKQKRRQYKRSKRIQQDTQSKKWKQGDLEKHYKEPKIRNLFEKDQSDQ